MPYTRYGHVNQVFVKVGDKVKQGDKIATNGTGNGQWLAHLHRDHPREIPGGNYGFYNIGWTKQRTSEVFNSPYNYPKALGAGYSHLGYDWLEYATYSSGKCYHPGLDENGAGGGNTDYDAPVYAVTDGVVEYVYSGTGANNGWGHLIVIKEQEPMDKEFVKTVADICGEDYGDNLNESEQKEASKKLKSKFSDLSIALEDEKNKPPVVVEKEIIKEVEVIKEIPVEVIKEVETIKEVIKEVMVYESDMSPVELLRLALRKFIA